MKGAIDKRAQTKTSLMVEPCIIISCLWKEWNALIHPARQECIPGSARVQSPPRAAPSVSGIDLGQLRGLRVNPPPGVCLFAPVLRAGFLRFGWSVRPGPWAQTPGRAGCGSVGLPPGLLPSVRAPFRFRSGCLPGAGSGAGAVPADGMKKAEGDPSAVRLSCLISA